MRTSTRATVGVVTELVDVHTTLGGGIVAFEIVGYGCRAGLGRLLENDCTTYGGVTAKDCNCFMAGD